MGQDLLLAVTEIREDEAAARARLAKLKFQESDIERFNNCGVFDFDAEPWGPDLPEMMRFRLSEAVSAVYEAAKSPGRDDCYINLDGSRTLVVTGGTSWGEEPSRNYDEFNLFNEFLGFPYWEEENSPDRLAWSEQRA
jgi:hypothetical protein